MSEQNCGNCKHADYDSEQGYICLNDNSEYLSDFVEHDHWCSDYEEEE